MKIINKSIHIVDYAKKELFKREIPDSFDDFINELIDHINENKYVRNYKTFSNNTEVIGSILKILNSQLDENFVSTQIDIIAKRLLNKEIDTSNRMKRLGTEVQKGSLIQALLHDENNDIYIYVLAKVEHNDFVDDKDFSFKTGFSKSKKTIWKSCLFDLTDPESENFNAKIYSDTGAKFWSDDFLELDMINNNEDNTLKAFRAMENTLNSALKNVATKDQTTLRNTIISYFRSNDFINYKEMIEEVLGSYDPIEATKKDISSLKEKMLELPEKKGFDFQFNSVSNVIKNRIKKEYPVNNGIELKITDAIDDITKTITAHRESNGERYLRIITNNDETYNRFEVNNINNS